MDALAKSANIERNSATRERKSVQIFNRGIEIQAVYPICCALCITIMLDLVISLHSAYLDSALNVSNFSTECIYNPQLCLILKLVSRFVN